MRKVRINGFRGLPYFQAFRSRPETSIFIQRVDRTNRFNAIIAGQDVRSFSDYPRLRLAERMPHFGNIAQSAQHAVNVTAAILRAMYYYDEPIKGATTNTDLVSREATSSSLRSQYTSDDSQEIKHKYAVDQIAEEKRQDPKLKSVIRLEAKTLGGFPSASFLGSILGALGKSDSSYHIPMDLLFAIDPSQRPGDVHNNPLASDHRIGATLDAVISQSITGELKLELLQHQSSVGTTQFISSSGAQYIPGNHHIGGWYFSEPTYDHHGNIQLQYCTITQGSADILSASLSKDVFGYEATHVAVSLAELENIDSTQKAFFSKNPHLKNNRVVFHEYGNKKHYVEYLPQWYNELCLRITASPASAVARTITIDPNTFEIVENHTSCSTKAFPNVGTELSLDILAAKGSDAPEKKRHIRDQAQQIVDMSNSSPMCKMLTRLSTEMKATLLFTGFKMRHLSAAPDGSTLDVTDTADQNAFFTQHLQMLQDLAGQLNQSSQHCKLMLSLTNSLLPGVTATSVSRRLLNSLTSLEPMLLASHASSEHSRINVSKIVQTKQLTQLSLRNPTEFYGLVHKALYKALTISAERIIRKPNITNCVPPRMRTSLSVIEAVRVIDLINAGRANEIPAKTCKQLWILLAKSQRHGRGNQLVIHSTPLLDFIETAIRNFIPATYNRCVHLPSMQDLLQKIDSDNVLSAAIDHFGNQSVKQLANHASSLFSAHRTQHAEQACQSDAIIEQHNSSQATP